MLLQGKFYFFVFPARGLQGLGFAFRARGLELGATRATLEVPVVGFARRDKFEGMQILQARH